MFCDIIILIIVIVNIDSIISITNIHRIIQNSSWNRSYSVSNSFTFISRIGCRRIFT
nr:MAG TPA: hypothetical protein [Caudoviricetes sp.]